MPKVSDYELDHMIDDHPNFEKVRRKKNKITRETSSVPEKKKRREAKVNYWDLPIEEDDD